MTEAQKRARQIIDGIRAARAWGRAHLILVAGVALGVAASLWLLEHDARLKREVELGQLRRETSTEVAALRAQAEAAIEEFHSYAQAIRSLESRRAALEREATELRQRLSLLREKENVRVQPAGTPGHAEMSGRVAPRLGPDGLQGRDSGVGSWESANDEKRNSKSENRPLSVVSRQLSVATDDELRTTDDPGPSIPNPESEIPIPGSQEDAQHAAPLQTCREQAAVQEQLISNCEERVGASQAVIDTLNLSVGDLQQNIRAQDEIAARLAAQHRAELKAARGSRLRSFGRALKYVGVGVVIGMVMAR